MELWIPVNNYSKYLSFT